MGVQPHQLDVALRLAFDATAGLDPIEVAADANLQQNGEVVSGVTSFGGDHSAETQPTKVEFIDEHIDHSHRIGVRDVVIQALGKQHALALMLSPDKRFMGRPC